MVLRAHIQASPAKSALLGVLVLVLLFLVARQLASGPKAAKAAAVAQLTPLVSASEDIASETFRVPEGLLPVPPLPERPARNPFAADPSLFQPAAGTVFQPPEAEDGKPPVDPVAAAVAEMRLQSTVTGAAPMATVAGTLLRVGDRIQGFTVSEIGVRFVVLEYADRRFVLRMD